MYSDCWRVWYIPDHTDRCRMAHGSRSESSLRTYWWSCCDIRLCLSSTGRRSSRPRTHTLPESHSKVPPLHSHTGSHSQCPNCLSCYNLKWKQVFSTILRLVNKNDQRGSWSCVINSLVSATVVNSCNISSKTYWAQHNTINYIASQIQIFHGCQHSGHRDLVKYRYSAYFDTFSCLPADHSPGYRSSRIPPPCCYRGQNSHVQHTHLCL